MFFRIDRNDFYMRRSTLRAIDNFAIFFHAFNRDMDFSNSVGIIFIGNPFFLNKYAKRFFVCDTSIM